MDGPAGPSSKTLQCLLSVCSLPKQDHAAVMQRVAVDEGAIGSEAGVVPVVYVNALDFVSTPISALVIATGFVVAAVRQKLVTDRPIGGDPHADKRMVLRVCLSDIRLSHRFCLLMFCRADRRQLDDKEQESDRDGPLETLVRSNVGVHQIVVRTGRTTISLTSTSSGCSTAKRTARPIASGVRAIARYVSIASAATGSVIVLARSLSTTPG